MIKLGSDQTAHSGVLTCVADLPGLVTLSASAGGVDVSSILTPQSFTVGGSVSGLIEAEGSNRGIAFTPAHSFALAYRRNFAIGISLKYSTGLQFPSGANSNSIYNVVFGGGGYNWMLMNNIGTRRMAAYETGVTPLSGTFANVFPVGTTRAVIIFNDLNWRMVAAAGTVLDETINHTSVGSDNPYSSALTSILRAVGTYQITLFDSLQITPGVPSAAQIAAYNAGGDLGAPALKCVVPESGDVIYDWSGNLYDSTVEAYSAGSALAQVLRAGITITVTGLTNTEQTISYDTGAIAPGTAITITATRTKAGFPTGRTPDISTESDTCTITAAAAPGSSVVGVALDKTSTSMDIGGTETLGFTIYPSTATIQTATWVSSNPSIATVHPTTGAITGVADGSASVTLTTDDGGFTDTCMVHVPLCHVAGVTLNATSISLPIGDTMTLVPTIWPSNASYTGVTWSSSAPSITSVSPAGIVSGLLNGSAVMTVTTLDGGFTAICAVTVPVTVSLSHSSIDGSGMSGGKGSGSDLIEEDYMMKQDLPNLEMIDFAFVDWIKSLNIFATYPDGWKKVPVIWYGAERSHQIKMEAELRDRSGSEIYPLITVGYNKGPSKDQKKKGVYWANVPAINDYYGGVLTVAKKLKPLKTSEFNNNQSKNRTGYQTGCYMDDTEDSSLLTYEYTSIPIPIYTTKNYEINIKANYQENINEILTPFLTYQNAGNDNYFVIEYNNYRYEVFLDAEVKDNSNTKKMAEEERKFESVITGNVLGYIVGDKKNNIRPNIVKREGITKVVVDMGVTDEIPE